MPLKKKITLKKLSRAKKLRPYTTFYTDYLDTSPIQFFEMLPLHFDSYTHTHANKLSP